MELYSNAEFPRGIGFPYVLAKVLDDIPGVDFSLS